MKDVSALREVTLGVRDVPDRARFFREAFGLSVLGHGFVDPGTAKALWDSDRLTEAVVLGRADLPQGPRVRLIAGHGPAPRPGAELLSPGALGVGFTTRGVEAVHARVAAAGIRFVTPPLRLTPGSVGPTGPVRYEAFGQAPDGEFVVLIERVDAATPYGAISEALGVSEPLHASYVVTNLDACCRFMREALAHETVIRDEGEGPLFEQLMGNPPGTRFRFEMLHRPGYASGRIIFIEYEGRGAQMPAVGPPARGIASLRYDCDDLGETLDRIAPAGGSLVRGPVMVVSETLGRGRVALVRPPFGTLLEVWGRA